MLLEAEAWLVLMEIFSFLLCSLSKSHCTQENQTQRFSFQGSLMTEEMYASV